MTKSKIGVATLVVSLVAAPASAQTTLDEGTFRHMVNGREHATETFSIKETGSGAGAVVIATGRIVFRDGDREELTSQLQVSGPGRSPTAYDILVSGDDEQRIRATSTGSRFSARIVTGSGERLREYLVSEGAVVAEVGIAHHHYFLAARVTNGRSAVRVPIIVPLEGRQVFADVTVSGPEPITVAGTEVESRRIVATVDGGDERRIWVDGQGRVLRVEVPARGLVAERLNAPG